MMSIWVNDILSDGTDFITTVINLMEIRRRGSFLGSYGFSGVDYVIKSRQKLF